MIVSNSIGESNSNGQTSLNDSTVQNALSASLV